MRTAEQEGIGTYYAYDANNNLTTKLLGNGCYTYFSYDPANRYESILNCFPNGAPLVYFEYQYDAAGRITSIGREAGVDIYYTYDNADRLTSETWSGAGGPLYAFEWNYDAVGNRLFQNNSGIGTYYHYNAGNELESNYSAGVWTYYDYDARGNCILIENRGEVNAAWNNGHLYATEDIPDGNEVLWQTQGATYFEYNDADLVTSIVYPSGVANYFHYDGKLRRYAMEDSTGLSYFVWDDTGMNLLMVKDDQGRITAEYEHGFTPIDGIGSIVRVKLTDWSDPQNPVTTLRYLHMDFRGTVFKVTDQNGNPVGNADYNAWGVRLEFDEVGPPSRLGYQSNCITLVDSEGQFVLTPTRVYHVATGRFLSADTQYPSNRIAAYGKLNQAPLAISTETTTKSAPNYVYVDDCPTQIVDPTGLAGEAALACAWATAAVEPTPCGEVIVGVVTVVGVCAGIFSLEEIFSRTRARVDPIPIQQTRRNRRRRKTCRCTRRYMSDADAERFGCAGQIYATVPAGTPLGTCQRLAKKTQPEACRAFYGHCGWLQ